MASKPPTKPPPGPDIGYYPMMHPYPGFRACTACGVLLTWDAHARTWVGPMGAVHGCEVSLIHTAAAWQYVVRLAEPRRFP
jgi:hypothetical protein